MHLSPYLTVTGWDKLEWVLAKMNFANPVSLVLSCVLLLDYFSAKLEQYFLKARLHLMQTLLVLLDKLKFLSKAFASPALTKIVTILCSPCQQMHLNTF